MNFWYRTTCNWCGGKIRIPKIRILFSPLVRECPHCHNLSRYWSLWRIVEEPVREREHILSREA